jgi:exodeoxyribonuclease V alpha subunit
VTQVDALDAFDAAVARGVAGSLREFNQAGILSTSDVHVGLRLAQLAETQDEAVVLGAAFAARAPRLGHVCVDLARVGETASADTDLPVDLDALPWPEPEDWPGKMAASPLVGVDRPLHLQGSTLYLDRLWSDELQVASDLSARAEDAAPGVDLTLLAAGLGELFSEGIDPDLPRMAAATAVLCRVSVVAGGPGTGKTTTVARVLVLLEAQAAAAGHRPPLVALAAPTGKAAARLGEAVHDGAEELPVGDEVRTRLLALEGSTIHRLLGFNPGNRTRFRHHRLNRLPHDVVVVDETSMVSLSLMARLVEAIRADARLILVGDPEQLASVEAGAVLGDIVGPATDALQMDETTRAQLAAVTGQAVPGGERTSASAIGNGIVVLRRVHRFGGGIARLAEAIQRGDADGAVAALQESDSNVQWLARDALLSPEGLDEVRALAVDSGRTVIEAAVDGFAAQAIDALGRFRLLCAHRRGPEGVTTWMQHVERWLHEEVVGFSTGADWYVGRPVIVTENDYALQLYNGDTGVVVATGDGRLAAAFERGGAVVEVSPTRLAAVDTVYAMTVHKSQGSQFDVVAFVLPGTDSRILTRELLYTAVTRARERLVVVGGEEAIRSAVERPISRASGLRSALWGDG